MTHSTYRFDVKTSKRRVGRRAAVLPGHTLGSAAEIDGLTAFQPIRV